MGDDGVWGARKAVGGKRFISHVSGHQMGRLIYPGKNSDCQ